MRPVSVIVPVHNGAEFLEEALAAIAAQTHPVVELVVVDDGSTDASVAIATRFLATVPRGALVPRATTAGVAAARNDGVRRASSDLIAFCDQDDVWLPDKLARQLAHLDAHPDHAVVMVRQVPFLDGVDEFPPWLLPDRVYGDLGGVLPCTALVRREAFETVGGFDETKSGVDDFDWLVRARHAGIGVAVWPEVLVRRRLHRGNESHDVARMRAGLFQALRDVRRRDGEAR
jgi:glycosyltransferase involved in cell wall biosynthesis